MTKQHGAVLWDLDGTLVDSEEYHWLAWKEILDREGISLTRPQFLSSFGQRNDAILRAWLGEDVSLELIRRIGDDKEAHYRELVRTAGAGSSSGSSGMGGTIASRRVAVKPLLRPLPGSNVEAVLDALHLRKWFQASTAAEDVQAGKPDPQVFLDRSLPPQCRAGDLYRRRRCSGRCRRSSASRHAEHRGRQERILARGRSRYDAAFRLAGRQFFFAAGTATRCHG